MESVLVCVLGNFDRVNQEPPYPDQFPKYLRCYRCLWETKELGCLLGSDICLASPGSSCMTLFIKNSKVPSVCLGPGTESAHFLSRLSDTVPALSLFLQSRPISTSAAWLCPARSWHVSTFRGCQARRKPRDPQLPGRSSGCLLPIFQQWFLPASLFSTSSQSSLLSLASFSSTLNGSCFLKRGL